MRENIKLFFHWMGLDDLSKREFLVVMMSFMVIAVAQLCACPSFFVGREHDDGLYVIAARSLALFSYKYQFLIWNPPIDVTPGYPFLLLPVAFLAGESLLAFQLFNLFLLVLCTLVVWMWFRKKFSAVTSILFMFMFGLNPFALFRSGVVMPEVAYLLLSLIILLTWDHSDEYGLWIGFGLSALYLIRPAAVTLIGALWIVLLISRKWKQLMGAILIPGIVFSLWARWSQHIGGVQENVELAENYSSQFLTASIAIFQSNLLKAAKSFGASFILPLNLKNPEINVALGILILVLALFFSIRETFRSKFTDPNALYCVILMLMHGFWPWWFDRYALPMLPFVLLYTVGMLAPPKTYNRIGGKNLALWALTIISFAMVGRHWVHGSINPKTPPYGETYAWIQKNTSPRDVIASELIGRDVLYMNRIGSSLPHAPDLGSFCRQLENLKVNYIFWENTLNYGFSLGLNAPIYKEIFLLISFINNHQVFKPVYYNKSENVVVYQVHCDRLNSSQKSMKTKI